MQANQKQLEAIKCVDGPLLIIAGAGSGKTATLTSRIAYMISERNILPSSILAVTFTNKAANEMKDRTGKAIGKEYHPHMMKNRHLPYMGTFHSFGIFVLKEVLHPSFPHLGISSPLEERKASGSAAPFSPEGERIQDGGLKKELNYEYISEKIGLKKDFLIYDESDKLSVLRDIIKNELGLIEKDFPPRQIAFFISDAKNKLISPKEYELQVDSKIKEVVAKVYSRYEKRLQANNAMDFDDILSKLLCVLQIPEILDFYQERYKYIMVDEYQDTNLTQYKIVRLLSEKYRNLAVVGDDWQSIYSWRGADMRNILSFQKDFPDAKVVKLEQNYRSTKKIIAAANVVISQNTQALKKELWTENEEGNHILYVTASDDKAEASYIAENITEYMKKQPSILNSFSQGEKESANLEPSSSNGRGDSEVRAYSDNLILYRTNAQSRSIEEALMKQAIPYKVIGGLKFYDRMEIKDILAYLRVILNPSDAVALKRIINTPSRKIGPKSIELLDSYKQNFAIEYFDVLESLDELEDFKPAVKMALQEFYQIMKECITLSEKISVKDLIEQIILKIGYEAYLKADFSQEEYESKIENLSELKNVASEYEGLAPREGLSLFLEEVALVSDLDAKGPQEAQTQQDYVTLMTIHTSKGLEQKRVFVAGLEDGMFPHSRTFVNPSELEEERRLMYVAMTRAREELFLTRAKERFYFGDYIRNPESRFIKEIPQELLETQEIGRSQSFSGFSDFSQNPFTSGTPLVKKTQSFNDVSAFRVGIRVEHHKFGIGMIDSLVGELAEIRFREGIKKMNIRIAPVKIVE